MKRDRTRYRRFSIYQEKSFKLTLNRIGLWSMALALCLFALSARLWAQEEKSQKRIHPEKTITAIRVNPNPPKIDGVLDDEVWQIAPLASGFRQRDPDEGKPASEETSFQIAYDDEALYIGIMCYDSQPDKIVRRIYRRDQIQYGETDWIGLRLDPHHDHQTGFGFAITPSGSFADNIIINDGGFDGTWDSVWEVRTAINDKGWSVELKIPYHALRFSPKEEYTWGINLDRRIIRKQEYDMWVFVPKNESGISSRNGHLQGIKGIQPPTHLEFLPFTVGRTTFEPKSSTNPKGRDLFSSAGLDLRYGLSSNFSLNATINPDFGQVEADPAVLNLSVFETFFQERRPFFIEGSNIFRTYIPLFHSRRIGKRPGYFSIPTNSRMLERPDTTTILGAAKLTGKTASKTTIGILNALTSAEYATIEDRVRAERREHRIEPLANYFVGRVQQDILDGNSTVGLLTTAINRDSGAPTYTGGLDWNLKWKNNGYAYTGQIAGSRAGAFNDRQNGYGGNFQIAKTSGRIWGSSRFELYSPDFNPNDLGFIWRVNLIDHFSRIRFRKTRPWGPFREMYLETSYGALWNYRHTWDGKTQRWVNLSKWLELVDFEATLKNYWWFRIDVEHAFKAMDDLDTRGGPIIVIPARTYYSIEVAGDNRMSIRPNAEFEWDSGEDGSVRRSLGLFVQIKPASNVEISAGPDYGWELNKAQWVTNVDDDGDRIPDHFVYGELKSRVLDITTRLNVTFSPTLSLQFYLQPFVAVGDYKNFRELARPSSYDFIPYSKLSFNPDFHQRSLRSNLVLRWEYSPGSALFVVWSQNRSASFDAPSFRPFDSVRHSFTDEGQNIFLVKLNYWLGI